jgi:capsule polysaccharide export protein KpsE/RkpR
MAGEYVEELNRVVTELNTSSAHRERVFLEGRLAEVQQDLESAEKGFSEFASKNTAIDIQAQGKAMIESAATLEGQMVAAQTELEGLKQIYAGDNVRVRSLQARVDELDRQLEKLGGKSDMASATDGLHAPSPNDPSMYPSIRELPLLGVSYADLYRTTKVQEATFETLTEEYELAKVQEAKETPSVKVLDAAAVPQRKSFPPRLPILLLCIFMTLGAAMAILLGHAHWAEVDPGDPGKVLMGEVFGALHASMPWAPPNGSRVQAMMHRVWPRPCGGTAREPPEKALDFICKLFTSR